MMHAWVWCGSLRSQAQVHSAPVFYRGTVSALSLWLDVHNAQKVRSVSSGLSSSFRCVLLTLAVHVGTWGPKQLYLFCSEKKPTLGKKGRASQTAFKGADGEQTVWVWFCWATSSVFHLKPKTNMGRPLCFPLTLSLLVNQSTYWCHHVTLSFSFLFTRKRWLFCFFIFHCPMKSAKQTRFIDRKFICESWSWLKCWLIFPG